MKKKEGQKSVREIRLWKSVWGLTTVGSCLHSLVVTWKIRASEGRLVMDLKW